MYLFVCHSTYVRIVIFAVVNPHHAPVQVFAQHRTRGKLALKHPSIGPPGIPPTSLANMVLCATPTASVWTCVSLTCRYVRYPPRPSGHVCSCVFFFVIFVSEGLARKTERRGLTWNRPRLGRRSLSCTRYVPGISHSYGIQFYTGRVARVTVFGVCL